MMGNAVCRVLQKRNMRIPRDISVTEFDGDYSGTQSLPRLTTMEVPRREMGRIAAAMLLRQLSGQTADSIVLPLKLLERESVCSLNSFSLEVPPD